MNKQPSEIRRWLITFTVSLSYFVFTIFGIVLAKYAPIIINYVDILFIPIGLSSILFLYLLFMTHEQRLELKIDPITLECAKLYGKGLSFKEIQEELNLSHLNEVKRLLTDFCKVKG